MIRSTVLLLALACSVSASTQTLQKLEFLASPERAVVSEPLLELQSENPCTIVIDLTIDRSGHVTESLASAPLSDCADLAVMRKAAEQARGYSFTPSSEAPLEQKARLTWTVGYIEQITMDEAVAPPAMIDEPQDEPLTLASVEEQPLFPGGQEAMYAYLAKEVKYPDDAEKAGIQGKVYIEFVVDKDGGITEVKLLRGLYPSIDLEAIRAVKSMPKWIPGRMNGKPVKVRYVMPIVFKL